MWLSLAVSLFVSWVGELFRQSWQSVFPLAQLAASFFFQQASRCGKRQKKYLILLIPGSGHQKTSCSSTILSSKQQIRAVFGDRTQKVIGKSLTRVLSSPWAHWIMLAVISQSTVKAHLEKSSLHSTMLKEGGVRGVRKPQNRTEIRQKTANRIRFFPEYRNRAYM